MSGANPRRRAARILLAILRDEGSLGTLLPEAGEPDGAFIRELCFGACRHYHELAALAGSLMKKPLKGKDMDIQCLLVLGLYQLLYLRVPDHAAINETVAAVKKSWARGLVNAVLRQALRQYPDYRAEALAEPARRYSHPDWLAARLRQDWPDHYLGILAGNQDRAPMTLRVNLARISRADYLRQLESAGIGARPGRLAPSAVVLSEPRAVDALPGFQQGLVSVQDEASQLCAPLLRLAPGQRVLDACAAPGGKTCAMLESEHSLSILAIDNEAQRLERVSENLQRLGLDAELRHADVNDTGAWWDGRAFDRVLLDVPCSATGVIRRHPDIKLLRQPAQVDDLARRQAHILSRAWDLLAPGGLLLYSTCSVLKAENSDRIAAFLAASPQARHLPIEADWGLDCGFGRQLLPGTDGADGFYYALLARHS